MFEGFTTTEIFAGVAVLLTVFYWYFTRNHGYWKKAGIPYVKPWPFVGSMILNFKKPLHQSEIERYKKYGRIYGYYEGNKPVLMVAEPDLLRDILLKDFQAFTDRRGRKVADPMAKKMLIRLDGEDWKRVRSIVSPTFSTGKIKRISGIFEDCANTLCNNFTKAVEKGEDVDAKELFGAFTMDVIASSAFSTKLDSHNQPNNQFVHNAKVAFSSGVSLRILIEVFAPSFVTYILSKLIRRNPVQFFSNLALDIVKERKKTGKVHNDFLQLLLDAHKESELETKSETGVKDIDANYLKEGGDEQIINNNYRKKALSEDEVLAQCVIFFLAGYDTTATTLTLVTFELASHPEVQEKVIQEIQTALSENQGKLTYEAIQQMKYLDNVISESLRLHPPAIRVERKAGRDYQLGQSGYTIPKGMVVGVPICAIHRDPKYYSKPDSFDPDRFSTEERAKRPAYTYLPFGGGPRTCVAMRFALMEVKMCLVHIFSRFRAKVSPNMKLPIQYDFNPFVMQPKEVLLRMEVIKDTQGAAQ